MHIDITPNGSRAQVNACEPGITREDVERLLEREGITSGIAWEHIDAAIDKVDCTGEPVYNVVVAEIVLGDYDIRFGNGERSMSSRELDAAIQGFRRVFLCANEQRGVDAVAETLFVRSKETFLTVDAVRRATNIFGRPVNIAVAPEVLPYNTDTITRVKNQVANRYEFSARITGYVCAMLDNRLHIIDPITISDDRMCLYYALLPVWYGKDALIDCVLEMMEKGRRSSDEAISRFEETKQITQALSSGSLVRKIIRRGVPPVPGTDGRIEFKVDCQPRSGGDESGSIDIRDFSPYREIEEGTVIAEICHAQTGIPGRDVYGEIISVDPVKTANFHAGENVVEKREDAKTLYVAGTTGILQRKGNFVRIEEKLMINGDVSSQTGNLRFEKDITISGNVSGGFVVECGSNLSISGGVEDGAKISCKGSLRVVGGIFGMKTTVCCRGNAEIGFIQNSSVTVYGSCDVRDYIYLSTLTCHGHLTVNGKSLMENNVGSVVGGKLMCMKPMKLHSVGTVAGTTELACGVIPDMFEKLKELRRSLPPLRNKIVTLQKKTGIKLTGMGLLDRVKKLPPHQRQYLTNVFRDLKAVVEMKEKMEKKIQQLETKALSPADEPLFIDIQKHVIPRIIIRMRECTRVIHDEEYKIRISIHRGRILFDRLGARNT